MSDTRTGSPVTTPTAKLTRVKAASAGLVFMLLVEFILGMAYNLYGSMPASGKSIGLFSNGWLIVHEIMALLLVAAAIQLVVRATGTGNGLARTTSWVGLIAIILAIGSGISFTRNGNNGSSLGMSLTFAIALGCYVINLIRLPSGES